MKKKIKGWEESLRNDLEELFPKLNEDDITKPSPNNRSAAIVLYAKAVIAIRSQRQALIERICYGDNRNDRKTKDK